MYYDPTWIFNEKPEKNQYPNITGLMDDKPKRPKRKAVPELTSMADVFRRTPAPERMQTIPASPIPTQKPETEPHLDTRENPGSTLDMQRDEFEKAFKERIGRNPNWLLHTRPGLAANPTHQQNYYGRKIDKPYAGDVITLSDPKYNIRQGLNVPITVIDELKKYAQAGGLTPEQTLLLAAISSNEDEFGTTRGMFGINSLYEDFPGGIRQLPGSYEAKKLYEYYSGDPYLDVINWLKRKTNNFQDIENMNPNFSKDRNVNPRGETYADRINRNAEILLSNPEFMRALLGDNVPNLTIKNQ